MSKLGEIHNCSPQALALLCCGGAGVRPRRSSAGWEDVHHVWEERGGLSEGAAVLRPQDWPLGRAGRRPRAAGVARHGRAAGKALRHRGQQQRLRIQEGRSPGETRHTSVLSCFLVDAGTEMYCLSPAKYANKTVCSAVAAGQALPHSPAELAVIYLLLSVLDTLSHPQSIKALALGILIHFETSLWWITSLACICPVSSTSVKFTLCCLYKHFF